ncbi:MAG: hypothetical protein U0929_04710 [Planctomycetaceae bacterium]
MGVRRLKEKKSVSAKQASANQLNTMKLPRLDRIGKVNGRPLEVLGALNARRCYWRQ